MKQGEVNHDDDISINDSTDSIDDFTNALDDLKDEVSRLKRQVKTLKKIALLSFFESKEDLKDFFNDIW